MPEQVNKMPQPNSGIKCIANTCHYNGSGDHCHAQKIEVQTCSANSIKMTHCATFMVRNWYNW